MATEAQIQANRRNCKQSTGPKTEAGKARSRRNALRHGFRAESGMLTKRMEARVNASIDRWRDELRPEGQAEDSLVRLAAWSGAQLEALAEQHSAIVRKQARKGVERFENQRIDEVESLIAELDDAEDPAPILEELATNSAGCAWMVQEWERLLARFHAQEGWDDASVRQVERLLDRDGRSNFQELATRPAATAEEIASSRSAIAEFMRAKKQYWMDLGKRTWEDVDRPLREEREALALAPLGRTGDRWLRYQATHSRHLHRSISELLRIRTYDREPRPTDFQGRGGLSGCERQRPNEADSTTQPLGFHSTYAKRTESAEAVPAGATPSPMIERSTASEQARLRERFQEIYEASERRRSAEISEKRRANEANFGAQPPVPATRSVKTPSRLGFVANRVVMGVIAFFASLLVLRATLSREVSPPIGFSIDASPVSGDGRVDRRGFDERRAVGSTSTNSANVSTTSKMGFEAFSMPMRK